MTTINTQNHPNKQPPLLTLYKQKYKTDRQIYDTIKENKETDEINRWIILQEIESLKARANPINIKKIYPNLSAMDAYYIPEDLDISDEELCEILY